MKANRIILHSIEALTSTASTQVAIHEMGLNVPTPKAALTNWPGPSSQTRPEIGTRNIPARHDAKFMTRSAIAARHHCIPNGQTRTTNSTTSPIAIAQTPTSRDCRNTAGQMMSANTQAAMSQAFAQVSDLELYHPVTSTPPAACSNFCTSCRCRTGTARSALL